MNKLIMSVGVALVIGAVEAYDNPYRGIPPAEIVGVNCQQPFTGVYEYGNVNQPALQYYYDVDDNGDADVYSMWYGGYDMWGSSEGYTYVYMQSGHTEFDISGYLEICGDSANLNCGIMIRNQYEVGGYCLAFNYRKNSNGDRFWNVNGRDNDWEGIHNIILGDSSLRGDDNFCWMRVRREANKFYFYCRESTEVDWTLFGTYTDENSLFGDSIYVGIYMCAGSGNGWSNFRYLSYSYVEGEFDPPSNVTVTRGTEEAILRWEGTSSASSYSIERMAEGESEWITLAVESASDTDFVYSDDSIARDGTIYTYRVVSLGENDKSAASNSVTTRFFEWGDGTGLLAAYYDLSEGTNTLVATRVEPVINFPWNSSGPVDDLTENFRAVYKGKLIIPMTAQYKFYWQVDDSLVVTIDGNIIENYGLVNLEYGEHDIFVSYEEVTDQAYFHLSWECGDYIVTPKDQTYNTIPTSQLKPASSITDVTAADWDGWCAKGGASNVYGNFSRASVDYEPTSGTYDIHYTTMDMWDTYEGYIYIWRKIKKSDFELSFKVNNLHTRIGQKVGAMVRKSTELGECCLTYNHRRDDSDQFYFLDVNGRQSVGAGITDHLTIDYTQYPCERELYMKVTKKGATYDFFYHTVGESEWIKVDTFEDDDGILGSRPTVGLVCFGCSASPEQRVIFSEVDFNESSNGLLVIIK